MKTCRGYKYRIYPTKKQKHLIHRTFGCARFVYNKMLEKSNELYKIGERFCSRNQFCYALTKLKQEIDWLREVDVHALVSANTDLASAFSNYFAGRTEKPKFKSKKQDSSYTSRCTHNGIRIENGKIRLPKIGFIKIKLHREPKGKIKLATVSRTGDNKYYISLVCENEVNCDYVPDIDNAIGLDYASDGLYVDSEGNKASTHKFYRESQKKLARQQRKLSRKIGNKKNKKKSNNYRKQQIKVNKIHRKIANQRKDFLHKLSTEIANRYDVVCVEDLNMSAMSNKGFGNGKATMDNGYGMFLTFLEYKLVDRNKFFVKIDKWYPSSQICSVCGSRNPTMKDLSKDVYECLDSCGNELNRNMNAAINIKNEGLRMVKEDSLNFFNRAGAAQIHACGDYVRRVSYGEAQQSLKQEVWRLSVKQSTLRGLFICLKFFLNFPNSIDFSMVLWYNKRVIKDNLKGGNEMKANEIKCKECRFWQSKNDIHGNCERKAPHSIFTREESCGIGLPKAKKPRTRLCQM